MYDILKPYLIIIVTAFFGVGGFVGWFFTRRKYKAEVDGKEISNGGELVKLYKEALVDLPHQYQQKFDYLNELFDVKEKMLKEEITLLKRENKMLKREIVHKDKRIAELEKIK